MHTLQPTIKRLAKMLYDYRCKQRDLPTYGELYDLLVEMIAIDRQTQQQPVDKKIDGPFQ